MSKQIAPLSGKELHNMILAGQLELDTAKNGKKGDITAADTPAGDMDKLPAKAAFESIAYGGGEIRQWWSYWPIVVDISGVQGQLPLPDLMDHTNNCGSTVGQHESINLADGNITTTGLIYPRFSLGAAKIFNMANEGYKWQMSIAGRIVSIEELKESEEVEVNGQIFTGPIYIVRQMVLREITTVPVGADVNTSFTLIKEEA